MTGYVTLSHSETGQAYDTEDNAKAATPGGLTPLASEKVNNIEAGFKTQFLDRRLTFNINGFWANYDDYQIQSVDSSNVNIAPVFRLLAIGKVRTRGLEVISRFRATDTFTFGASLAYADSTIRDYPAAACYIGQTAATGCNPATVVGGVTIPANQGNLAGLGLPDSPDLKLNLFADLTVPLSDDLEATVGATYRYQTKVHYDLLGDPLTTQNGFGVANLSVGIGDADGDWQVEAFVNNLFDKTYYTRITDMQNRFVGSGVVLNARYDRSSFRYAGIRTSFSF